MLIASLSKV